MAAGTAGETVDSRRAGRRRRIGSWRWYYRLLRAGILRVQYVHYRAVLLDGAGTAGPQN